MTEAKSRREQAQDIATEMGEFSMSELAAELGSIGFWNESEQAADLRRGLIARSKVFIKEKDKNGCPVFVAISSGPGALWKKWVHCTRVESRRAIQILAVGLRDYDETLQKLREAHEDRFKEEVTVPRASNPRDWDKDSEYPPISR